MSVVRYEALTMRYQDASLSVIEGQESANSLNAGRYPILLSQQEMRAMDFEGRVLVWLRNNGQMPSQRAGLTGNICRMVNMLDAAYKRAMVDYKKCIEIAYDKDKANLQALNHRLAQDLDMSNYTRKYSLIGLCFLLVGAIPGLIAGRVADQNRDRANTLKTIETRREQCSHRRAALHAISTLEKTRETQMRIMLQNRVWALLGDLRDLKRVGETDISKKGELVQLHKVYKVHFLADNAPWIMRDLNITDFLRQI